jgi:hypothetical protein
MKKYLLFIFILFSVNASAQTSVYHPFPDSNATWIVLKSCATWNGPLFCPCTIKTRYLLTGDTLISGNIYHIISEENYGSCPPECDCIEHLNGHHYIREDSSKKIWIYNPSTMTDSLVYDFNLSAGDTISNSILNHQNDLMIIQSIDSIFIGNSFRKKYNYSWNGNNFTCTNFLVEGIGAGGGLLSPFCGFGCPGNSSRMLLCFQQDNSQLYMRSNDSCITGDTNSYCVFNVGLLMLKQGQIFSLSPNPATDQLKIDNGELKIDRIEIYNVLGEKRLTLSPSPNGEGLRVDVSSLASGIYFIKVKGEKEERIGKFVKQ